MRRINIAVEEIEMEGDYRDDVPGLRLTCDRCGHVVEVFGTEEKSVKYGGARMREQCPREESNLYYAGIESDPDPDSETVEWATPLVKKSRTFAPTPLPNKGEWVWDEYQTHAIEEINAWLASGRGGVFKVFGFAGVGKSELVRYFAAQNVQRIIEPRGIGWECQVVLKAQVAAYTGKAAQVLQAKGVSQARTIHNMIYMLLDRKELEAERTQLKKVIKDLKGAKKQAAEKRLTELRRILNRPAFEPNPNAFAGRDVSMIILDECSMIDDKIAKDLQSYGIPILVFGDPVQLPPVEGTTLGYYMRSDPDVLLEEIHRQAKDNPIIQLGHSVRLFGASALIPGQYKNYSVVQSDLPLDWPREYAKGDSQLLVGRIKTKDACNREAREYLGFDSPFPMVDERLICRRNDHERGLVNGSQWIVRAVAAPEASEFVWLQLDGGGRLVKCCAWKGLFTLGEVAFKKLYRDNLRELIKAQQFDWAYAITMHRAQGSEWDRVMLYAQPQEYNFMLSYRRNWLYVGVTRAKKQLTVII